MLDDYQDLIDELLGTPTVVREALAAGATPEALALVSALHQRDAAVLDRIQRLRTETAPHLTVLPPFEEVATSAGTPDDPEAMLSSFETTRGDLVSTLMNLTMSDWQRRATSDAGGEVSLADEVERHVEFDEAFRARFGA
jgi:hypothetical protein